MTSHENQLEISTRKNIVHSKKGKNTNCAKIAVSAHKMRKICAEKNRVTSCDISPAQNLKKGGFFVTLRQNENIKIFANFPTSIFEIVHFIVKRR